MADDLSDLPWTGGVGAGPFISKHPSTPPPWMRPSEPQEIPADMVALLRQIIDQIHADAPSGLLSRDLIQLATTLEQRLPREAKR